MGIPKGKAERVDRSSTSINSAASKNKEAISEALVSCVNLVVNSLKKEFRGEACLNKGYLLAGVGGMSLEKNEGVEGVVGIGEA